MSTKHQAGAIKRPQPPRVNGGTNAPNGAPANGGNSGGQYAPRTEPDPLIEGKARVMLEVESFGKTKEGRTVGSGRVLEVLGDNLGIEGFKPEIGMVAFLPHGRTEDQLGCAELLEKWGWGHGSVVALDCGRNINTDHQDKTPLWGAKVWCIPGFLGSKKVAPPTAVEKAESAAQSLVERLKGEIGEVAQQWAIADPERSDNEAVENAKRLMAAFTEGELQKVRTELGNLRSRVSDLVKPAIMAGAIKEAVADIAALLDF